MSCKPMTQNLKAHIVPAHWWVGRITSAYPHYWKTYFKPLSALVVRRELVNTEYLVSLGQNYWHPPRVMGRDLGRPLVRLYYVASMMPLDEYEVQGCQ